MVAALDAILDDVAAHAAALPDTGSLRDDLLALLSPLAELIASPAGTALTRAAVAQGSSSAVAELAARRFNAGGVAPMQQLVERAQARGEWRAGIDANQLMFTLVGAIMHRTLLEHADVSPKWVASLIDLVLYGTLPR